MKKDIVSTVLSASLGLSGAHASANCTSSAPLPSAADKGNYLCLDCQVLDDWNVNIFIRTTVNEDVPTWRRSDRVTVTNGTNWAIYSFSGTGSQLTRISSGTGIGSGTQRNHKNGKLCTSTASTNGTGSVALMNYMTTTSDYDPFGLYGYRPDLYNYANSARTGYVTMEEYMTSYYNAYYSNYYNNLSSSGM